MSLNNIQLHPQQLANLYADVLIDAPAAVSKKESFKFFGKNKRNILLLVAKSNVAFLEEGELNFLSNVLAACKLSIADCAIVNLCALDGSPTCQSLVSFFESRSVILFDVTPESIDLPFNFPHFQLQQFSSSVYLSAPSLKELESEKALKAKLWNCLKNLFGL